jgi:hypothetical protein
MEELKISPTRNTPEIVLSPDGQLKIKGRSISENAGQFYVPVEKWLTGYLKNPARVTTVDMNFEYFNSSSAKIMIHLLQKIAYVSLKQKKAVFNWYYEDGDEDILERGQFFSQVLNVKFNFIKVS